MNRTGKVRSFYMHCRLHGWVTSYQVQLTAWHLLTSVPLLLYLALFLYSTVYCFVHATCPLNVCLAIACSFCLECPIILQVIPSCPRSVWMLLATFPTVPSGSDPEMRWRNEMHVTGMWVTPSGAGLWTTTELSSILPHCFSHCCQPVYSVPQWHW